MAFHSVGTHDELGWSPLDSEALEDLGLLFDVNLGGDEFGADPFYDPLVRIDLGFQPSTAASGRCGAEIEESRFRLILRGLQCLVGVLEPVDGECDHDDPPWERRARPNACSPTIIALTREPAPRYYYAPMERT